MKLVLILMIRNESKILQRCLEAVSNLVDAFCICDTGSTDNTCEIAEEFLKTHAGCLTKTEWRDFGHNRTLSFEAAQEFCRNNDYNLNETYGLLLDADMVFVPGTLRDEFLNEIGYTIIQCAGNLEYPNCRLVRMDYTWKCRGVTHEYWDGPTSSLAKSVCYIDDRNDGGCKSDKFERDARLLEKGLQDEPENVRYMFYLAQTYHSLGRWQDSTKMYKKRIAAGGWDEEVWYSQYMIAQCHQNLGNIEKFEEWMLRAYKYRPSRAESLYKLAKYFREKGQHYKAYQYAQMGTGIPKSHDSLFIEKDVYEGLFDYEKTILLYYMRGGQIDGLRESVKYLLTQTHNLDSVYRNMPYYITPIGTNVSPFPVIGDLCGQDYHPSSTSLVNYNGSTYYNVRFVNYFIDQRNGSYLMKEGTINDSNLVRTQNVCLGGPTPVVMKDSSVTLERRASHIRGLEDIRLYTDAANTLKFLAVTAEYSDKIRVLAGTYHTDGRYSECKVIQPPVESECEKNWIPISNTNDIVYHWYPLRVGKIADSKLVITKTHTTPWFFSHIRGSACPVRIDNELWFLVHFVEYSSPRKYYHGFVVLDSDTYQPRRISLPFLFREKTIEYCLGVQRRENTMRCIVSTMDNHPCNVDIPLTSLEWMNL